MLMSEVIQIGEIEPGERLGAAYVLGDLSTNEEVIVASASGKNDEKHASGSYGVAAEVYGGLGGSAAYN
jgi:hypothetical protein